MLKEHRCPHCSKLFFKGDITHAVIEVKCKNCKNIHRIEMAGGKISIDKDNNICLAEAK